MLPLYFRSFVDRDTFARFAGIGVGHQVQLNRVSSDIHNILEVDEEPEGDDLSQHQAESSRGPREVHGDPGRVGTPGNDPAESILDPDVDEAQLDPGSDFDENSDHDSCSDSDPASDDESLCNSDDDSSDEDEDNMADSPEFSF